MSEPKEQLIPPDDLIDKWVKQLQVSRGQLKNPDLFAPVRLVPIGTLANAAQWGADQELKACCRWLEENDMLKRAHHDLFTFRRPSISKQQALEEFDGLMIELDFAGNHIICANRIRRALEALPDE